MYMKIYLFFLLFSDSYANEVFQDKIKEDKSIDGHPVKCRDIVGKNVYMFEVLPGLGWDNIQNTELSQVLSRKYYQCRLTEDGKYLIPDNTILIPVKQSDVDIYAEWFSSMTEYKSVDAVSVNLGGSISVGLAGAAGVSGSFSVGYQRAKKHVSKSTTKKYISRVQAKYNRYRVLADPGSELHPSFKARLLEIALSDYNGHHKLAEYQSQMLIRDFGTHVLTRMDAGGVLYKEDHIDTRSKFVDDVQRTQLQFGAGQSFSLIFDDVSVGRSLQFGVSKSKMTEMLNTYISKTTFSVIKSYGGTYFDGNISSRVWTQSLDNNLVSIDRDGVPLFELITQNTLPELPLDMILKLGQSVKDAYLAYYKHNAYRGCMNPDMEKFDIKANVPYEAACGDNKFENEYFGGVFQTCSMSLSNAGDTCTKKGYSQKNVLTRDFSCPVGYKAIKLISDAITDSQYHERHATIWHRRRHSYTTHSRGEYTAYWCAREPSQSPDQKLFFGGVFSTNFKPNILTGGFSCPLDFIQLRVADDVFICGSGDGQNVGIKFGGFFSCSNGNPIALTLNMTKEKASHIFDSDPNTWPKRCPHGMLQQTFSMSSNCELEFCSDVMTPNGQVQLPVIRRPPFVKRPSVPPGNFSEIVIMSNGTWYKNEAAFEKMVEMESQDEKMKKYKEAQDALEKASMAEADLYSDRGFESGSQTLFKSEKTLSKSERGTGLPPYAIVIISSLATSLCIGLTTMAVVKYRKIKQNGSAYAKVVTYQSNVNLVPADVEDDYRATEEGQNVEM